jgi:hypothetical protein
MASESQRVFFNCSKKISNALGVKAQRDIMTKLSELSDQDVAIIKARINRGDEYAEIAADYRLNQGRIADLKFGRRRSEVKAAKLADEAPTRIGARQMPLFPIPTSDGYARRRRRNS